MIFLFPRWDMLISWRVPFTIYCVGCFPTVSSTCGGATKNHRRFWVGKNFGGKTAAGQVDLAKKEVYKHPQYYYIGSLVLKQTIGEIHLGWWKPHSFVCAIFTALFVGGENVVDFDSFSSISILNHNSTGCFQPALPRFFATIRRTLSVSKKEQDMKAWRITFECCVSAVWGYFSWLVNLPTPSVV